MTRTTTFMLLLVLAAGAWLEAAPLRVFVGIAPLRECLARVGGPLVAVEVFLPRGASPETYSPEPRKLASLSRADMYVSVNVPFEQSLCRKIRGTFPKLMILDGARGMTMIPMTEPHHHEGEEESGEDVDHCGGAMDPHVWLDVDNVCCLARSFAAELNRMYPEQAPGIQKRLNDYVGELQQLDGVLMKQLAGRKSRQVFVVHPAFGYFLRRYHLEQHAIELGGKTPTGFQLARIIREAGAQKADRIYVQPQFNRKTADVIARQMKAEIVVLDPLPEEYSEGLKKLASALLK